METTFYSFQSNIRHFLNSLLKNPIKAQPSDFLKERGFNKKKLINILLKRDVIKRHEKIDDNDEKTNYKVKYNVVRDKFERKLKRIYNKYFENNEGHEEEIDEATACGASSGPYVGKALFSTPIKKEIETESVNKKIRNIYITEKQFEVLMQEIINIQYRFL